MDTGLPYNKYSSIFCATFFTDYTRFMVAIEYVTYISEVWVEG